MKDKDIFCFVSYEEMQALDRDLIRVLDHEFLAVEEFPNTSEVKAMRSAKNKVDSVKKNLNHNFQNISSSSEKRWIAENLFRTYIRAVYLYFFAKYMRNKENDINFLHFAEPLENIKGLSFRG